MGIDAWNIGIDLVLEDEILTGLAKVDDGLDKIQSAVDSINSSLTKMTGIVATATGSVRGLAGAFSDAANAAERIQRAANGFNSPSGGGVNPGGSGPSDNGYRPNWTYPGITDGSGGGGRGNGGGNTPLYLSGPGGSNGNGGGGVPLYPGGGGSGNGGDGGPGGGRAGGGGAGFHGVMGDVFAAYYGSGIVAGAVKGATAPAMDVQTQLTNIANMAPAGSNTKQIQNQFLAEAYKLQQQYPGMSVGQSLTMLANLYSVDRDSNSVISMAPGYAQSGYVLAHATGGADTNDELYALLRSSEDMGRLNLRNRDGTINTGRASALAAQVARISASSAGNITGQGILTLVGQAGPIATGLSDVALERAILISQSLGMSQTGSGLNAMGQEFIGGKMSQATARSLHEAGALPTYAPDPDGSGKMIRIFGQDGKITAPFKYGIGQVMVPAGSLMNQAQAAADPLEYVREHLVEQYLNPDGSIKAGQSVALQAALNRDFSRIPGMKLAGADVYQMLIRDRQIGNIAAMPTNAQLAAADAGTANAQASGVAAAGNAALVTLGGDLLPGIVKGLTTFDAGLNNINKDMLAHPIISTDIVKGVVAAATTGVGALTTVAINVVGRRMGAFAIGEGLDPAGGGFVAFLALAIGDAIVKYSGGTYGPPRASRQNLLGPAGTAGDPVHVKVSPLAPGTEWMPTGPTGFNQQMTSPMPGRPLLQR
jgi:hypothetical protein